MTQIAEKVGDNSVHLGDMKFLIAGIDFTCKIDWVPHFGDSSTFITEMRALLQEPAARGVHEGSVL